MRVFISSTCYDLLDLRAELEAFFRDANMVPVLSDSLASEFKTLPDQNSIESCLANARSCDAFIIILSQRYGPSLGPAGFDDVSATHLEYREAKKAGKPIHMFVRDRLEADFSIWRKNREQPDLKLNWCADRKDWRIFELIEEHRKLVAEPNSNWLWPFRDSVEIKQRLQADFKDAFARAAVTHLIRSGRTPLFDVRCLIRSSDAECFQMEIRFQNLGNAAALSPMLQLNGKLNRYPLPGLPPNHHHTVFARWALSGLRLAIPTQLTYSLLTGHQLVDEGELTINLHSTAPELDRITYTLKSRKFTGVTDSTLLITS